MLVTFEESAEKVSANVASLGFDLDGLQRDHLLVVHALRSGWRHNEHRQCACPQQ